VDEGEAGSVDVTALPDMSTAVHNDVEGHDTDVSKLPGSAVATVQLELASGARELSTFPSPSTAAQNVAEGHDTAPGRAPPDPRPVSSTRWILQVDGSVGCVDVKTFPAWSTATHQLDGHAKPAGPFEPSICSTVHALAPPVGSVDLAAFPMLSTARQNDAEGHDTANRPERPGIPGPNGTYSTELTVHADAPPAGSLEVTTFPTWSTATHIDTAGQETALSRTVFAWSTVARCQLGEALVGLVETTTPVASTATQSEIEAHETPNSALEPSTFRSFHAEAPPVGFVEVITSPAPSTAAQNAGDEHDTLAIPKNPGVGSTFRERHLDAPPDGALEVRTLPWRSAATHNETDGHDRAVSPDAGNNPARLLSRGVSFHAPAPPEGVADVSRSPEPSAPTHSDADGHASATIPSSNGAGMILLSTRAMRQLLGPAVGSADARMSPRASPPTHSDAVGHETADRGVCPAPGAGLA
jgi:hypothetical protein